MHYNRPPLPPMNAANNGWQQPPLNVASTSQMMPPTSYQPNAVFNGPVANGYPPKMTPPPLQSQDNRSTLQSPHASAPSFPNFAPPQAPTSSMAYNQPPVNGHTAGPPLNSFRPLGPPPGSMGQPPMPPMSQFQHMVPPTSSVGSISTMSRPPSMPPLPPSVGQRPSAPPTPSMSNKPYPPQQPSYNNMPTQPAANLPGYTSMSKDFDRMGFQDSQSPDRPINLMQVPNVLAVGDMIPTEVSLRGNNNVRCDRSIFRPTFNAVPQSSDILKKTRLPFGIVLHPFRDLKQLNVISTSTIVRCKSCRTYINPYVVITDPRHWKCNICYRNNDLPDEMNWDPMTKTYGDPSRRPELRNATIEFIAPQEYMLRAPMAAVYVFILDVSVNAVDSGYLSTFCGQLLSMLDNLPGDERLAIGFITVDSSVHFWRFASADQPAEQLICCDVDDIFAPCPDSLIVNLKQKREAIDHFLQTLPSHFEKTQDNHSALGAALQVAHDIIQDNGGRITIMQTIMPDVGPGALKVREDPNERASNETAHLTHASDFYQRLALDCNGHQVAIDLFLMNSKPADLATLGDMARYCGGCIHYFPNLHILRNAVEMQRYEATLRRYLSRKIGFEAVLRIRCTRGLQLKQFFGNFFVRSTDLLALPNVNPDSAVAVTIDYDEQLTDGGNVCFQAALLYTSSRGDRRIRVHTLCLPVTNRISLVHQSADVFAIVAMLGRMASDKCCVNGLSLTDAKEAMVNACIDALGAYAIHSLPIATGGLDCLLAPQQHLRLLPLYTLALLKSPAFATGYSIKTDGRIYEMSVMRTMPVDQLMLIVHPTLYALHNLAEYTRDADDEQSISMPPQMQLSYASVEGHGLYLMDAGTTLLLYVTRGLSQHLCQAVFSAASTMTIDEDMPKLPVLDNDYSTNIRALLSHLNDARPFKAPLQVIREDSQTRNLFIRRLVEDRSESSYSYIDFLKHVRKELPQR